MTNYSTATKFFFLRDRNRTPVACIATSWRDDGSILNFGMSAWNPTDVFDRTLAKTTAETRMRSGKNVWTRAFLRDVGNVKLALMKYIADARSRPILDLNTNRAWWSQRARDAARLWLAEYDRRQRHEENVKNLVLLLRSALNLPVGTLEEGGGLVLFD